MRDSDICVVSPCTHSLGLVPDIQLEGWENGLLSTEMAQAMLSGCIVAMTPPQIHHGELIVSCVM
jgi:hypothetical protein